MVTQYVRFLPCLCGSNFVAVNLFSETFVVVFTLDVFCALGSSFEGSFIVRGVFPTILEFDAGSFPVLFVAEVIRGFEDCIIGYYNIQDTMIAISGAKKLRRYKGTTLITFNLLQVSIEYNSVCKFVHICIESICCFQKRFILCLSTDSFKY